MYKDLIEKVCDFLRSVDTPVGITCSKPVTVDELDQLEERLGFALPTDLRNFYIDVGNGIRLRWEESSAPQDEILGYLEIFGLDALYEWHIRIQELYVESKIDYDFPFVEDVKKAKRVLEAKRQWIDMWEDGGRYTVCLDCKSGQVLSNDHLWWSCNFNAQLQGKFMAKSFSDFFKKWASVCFWQPIDPSCMPNDFTDFLPWNSTDVPDRYRLPD